LIKTACVAASKRDAVIFGARTSPNVQSTMLATHHPRQNHLLGALPAADYARLQCELELVPLPLGLALCEAHAQQGYVYLPTSSIVSLLYAMHDGAAAEIAVVGNEGVVGLALFMGGETTPSRAVVQSAGYAWRLKGSVLKREFERAGALQYLLLRYTQALITQIAQNAACKRSRHAREQQLCRWLLLSLDRLACNELTLSEALIAHVLGVGRETVRETAGKLQAGGALHCRRGQITVRDRAQLEARACACYGVVKGESERLSLRKCAAAEEVS
jgi:CRP-like cAMP-binding protein